MTRQQKGSGLGNHSPQDRLGSLRPIGQPDNRISGEVSGNCASTSALQDCLRQVTDTDRAHRNRQAVADASARARTMGTVERRRVATDCCDVARRLGVEAACQPEHVAAALIRLQTSYLQRAAAYMQGVAR